MTIESWLLETINVEYMRTNDLPKAIEKVVLKRNKSIQ